MKKVVKLVELVYELGLLAHHSYDLKSVLEAISKRILQETRASFTGINLVDEDQKEFVLTVGVLKNGDVLSPGQRQSLSKGVVGRAIRTGQLICVENTSESEDFVSLVPGMQSELAVPLFFGGKVIGVLNIESDQVGQFGKTEIALLQATANPIALAIENARLYQEERKRYSQVSMLNQLNRVLTSTVNVEILIKRVLDTIRKQLGYTFVAIGLLNEDNKVVLKAMNTTVSVNLPLGHAQEVGEGVVGEVLATGKSLLIPDVRKRENVVRTHEDLLCEMCCPLRVGDRVFGYVDAEELDTNAFDENDLLVLETIADHIAQAIENTENLRRVNKLREDLARMIIHDLRNPLSVIFSLLQMLELGGVNLEETKRKEYLKRAKNSCSEIFTLLDTLLELQKIEEGKLELHYEKVNPTEIVLQIVNSLQVKAEETGKLLTCDFPVDLPCIKVDRKLFIRVLQNLVINAIKFTAPGGHIHITIKPSSAQILQKHLKTAKAGMLFSVRDDGCGIPSSELENIFDKFTTLKPQSRSETRGTGLGLTFCREVTLAHKGTIWVKSQVGKGSTFHVLLPIEKQ
jgi:signal transduction histidine kinase